jgi:hypothetical protein
MPALARGQENTPSIINWFTTVNGVLTDMFAVEFQIWDITGGLPGDVIFPTPGDAGVWEDVTSNAGHYSVGHYYAYDSGNAQGWTPGIAEPVGTHRVKWRWKATAGSPYQSDAEDFEVLVQSAGSSVDTYISVDDVRDEGLLVADYPDDKVLAYISIWQAFLERACRQWFNARSLILEVDGNESDTLFFGVPIIAVEYVKINNSGEQLDSTLYRVYNRNGALDDRHNPKICLVGPDAYEDIFVAPVTWGRLRFQKGRQNQEIKGIFGYVEADGSTPALIKHALLKLVIEKLTEPLYDAVAGSSGAPILGSILEEETDDHRIKYSGAPTADRRAGLSGITDDPEILDIVKLYRAPIGIAAPSHWSIQ